MKPSARRVRDRLRQGPATTHDLCQPEVGGVRFGGRIEELRNDEGYVIDRQFVCPGSHLYTLIAEPEISTNPPREGDAVMTFAAVSTQARGSARSPVAAVSRDDEDNAGRASGAHVTGQGRSAADPLAGRLVDHAVADRANVPAPDAAPPVSSRLAGALFDADVYRASNTCQEAAA